MNGDQWGPIIMDVSFFCKTCRKNVRGRLTVYSDAAYTTCQEKHHATYNNPNEIPNLMGWIGGKDSDSGDENLERRNDGIERR